MKPPPAPSAQWLTGSGGVACARSEDDTIGDLKKLLAAQIGAPTRSHPPHKLGPHQGASIGSPRQHMASFGLEGAGAALLEPTNLPH
jgi:hypothetical protein